MSEPDGTEVDVEESEVNFLDADVVSCEELADGDSVGIIPTELQGQIRERCPLEAPALSCSFELDTFDAAQVLTMIMADRRTEPALNFWM